MAAFSGDEHDRLGANRLTSPNRVEPLIRLGFDVDPGRLDPERLGRASVIETLSGQARRRKEQGVGA